MLRLEEIDMLHADSAESFRRGIATGGMVPQKPSNKAVDTADTDGGAQGSTAAGSPAAGTSGKGITSSVSRTRPASLMQDKEREALKQDKLKQGMASNKKLRKRSVTLGGTSGLLHDKHGYDGHRDSHATKLANSRGDVSSSAAVMHTAVGVRLYMLVDLVLEEKLSRAAWPAWNAVCMKLRTNSERLKQRALFRLPRIYQASVRFLVASTILTDSLLLASHAARLMRNVHPDDGWRQHAYVGALIDLLLNLLLTWCLAVFVNAITDMQTPFGGECLDMPGLSYVCGSAEVSLRMMVGAEQLHKSPRKDQAHFGLFGLLNRPLDRKRLMHQQEGAVRGKKDEEEEEEEEDADGGDE